MRLNRKNIRLKDYDYSKDGYYYITICTKNRKEILSKIEIYNTGFNRDKLINVGADALGCSKQKNNIKIFDKHKSEVVGVGVLDDPKKIQVKLTTYGEIIEKQIKETNNIYKDIKIENYIIMPNHVHMIIKLKRQKNGSP